MKVRVLVSFNGLRRGDVGTVSGKDAQDKARAYAASGLLEVISDGERETGQGRPATGDPGSQPA